VAHRNLGAACARAADLALAHAAEALRLRPGDPSTHNNLGPILLDLGRLEEAEARFAEALWLDPGLAPAHRHIGLALARRHRPSGAAPPPPRRARLRPGAGAPPPRPGRGAGAARESQRGRPAVRRGDYPRPGPLRRSRAARPGPRPPSGAGQVARPPRRP